MSKERYLQLLKERKKLHKKCYRYKKVFIYAKKRRDELGKMSHIDLWAYHKQEAKDVADIGLMYRVYQKQLNYVIELINLYKKVKQ